MFTADYLHPGDLALAPPALARELPVISASPDTILDVLLAQTHRPRAELQALGGRSRVFAGAWHDPLKIAEGVIADYRRRR